MIIKKKLLLLTLFLIIIFQSFFYLNNHQKTSFRFLKWTAEEISIGKLISISFFSGLFISTLLNSKVTNLKKNTFENIEEDDDPLNRNEDIKSNIEIPPQRDIRDAQPTISVNYRVIKNTEKNNSYSEENYSDSFDDKDDWNNDDNDW
tara:strand:+ start:19 stop:462 length:444 start_codon:yes stop_codon:yes gene_type:complete